MKLLLTFAAASLLLVACSKPEMAFPDSNEESVFETRGSITVTTDPATEITQLSALSGGSVSNSGGGNSTSERGICYSTTPNPTVADVVIVSGSGAGTFTCPMPDLATSTIYYIRAYAIKHGDVTYGNQVSFTTYPDDGPMSDIEGNVYQTINIGGQIWMMENLNTTTYNDGTPIPNVTDPVEWYNLSTGAYCNFDNDESNAITYGRLYNWFAVDDAHQLAPTGWHIPTINELATLVNYLGGADVAGGKLKETGAGHWGSYNTASNSSGYTALPGGRRLLSFVTNAAFFSALGITGNWWSSSQGWNSDYAQWVRLQTNDFVESTFSGFSGGTGYDPHSKKNGYSVRCVKD